MKKPLVPALAVSLFAHLSVFAAIAVYEPLNYAQSGGFTEVYIVKSEAVGSTESPPLAGAESSPYEEEQTNNQTRQAAPADQQQTMPKITDGQWPPLQEQQASNEPDNNLLETAAPSFSTEQMPAPLPNQTVSAPVLGNSDEQWPPLLEAQPPQELIFPEPAYPVTARKRKLEGSVLLAIYIDRNGKVANMEVLSSSGHKILDNAALSVKDKLKYAPALENGKAVDFMLTKTVTFRLENK